MNALELADWIKDTEFYNNSDPNINDRMDEVESMLRQQQAKIEALKQELALWRLSKSSEEIESTPSESDKFCDTHCVWTDHHPECKHAKYRR
jgi:hypothetical protein